MYFTIWEKIQDDKTGTYSSLRLISVTDKQLRHKSPCDVLDCQNSWTVCDMRNNWQPCHASVWPQCASSGPTSFSPSDSLSTATYLPPRRPSEPLRSLWIWMWDVYGEYASSERSFLCHWPTFCILTQPNAQEVWVATISDTNHTNHTLCDNYKSHN